MLKLLIAISVFQIKFTNGLENENLQFSQKYFQADTTRIFTGKIVKTPSHHFLLTFPNCPKNDAELIQGVELCVTWKPSIKVNTSKSIFRMVSHDMGRKGKKTPTDSKKIHYHMAGNYTFDVTSAFSIKNQTEKTKTILIQVSPINVALFHGKKFEFMPKGDLIQASLVFHTLDLNQDRIKIERLKREAKRYVNIF